MSSGRRWRVLRYGIGHQNIPLQYVIGTSWSLKLKYKNKVIDTHGHMAYPDPDDVSKKVEIEFSQPFQKLIKGLDTLCGKMHFSKY